VRHRPYIVAAFTLALLATIIGWSQSMIHKLVPLGPLAFWFPLVVLTGANNFVAVLVSVIQFPLFAISFTFAIRRWAVGKVLAALLLAYAIMVAIAYVSLNAK